MEVSQVTCTAFAGPKKIASGSPLEVGTKVKKYFDQNPNESLLIFNDATSEQLELDLRGSKEEVLARLAQPEEPKEKSGPGRPKLGVISKEIGLLPRHWEWLALQSGGASVTLRKLVEEAKKNSAEKDLRRQSQNVAYKFMATMAGDLPHFEEATRALFAGNKALFETLCAKWPKDILNHSLMLGEAALS